MLFICFITGNRYFILLATEYAWSLTDINAELPEELGTLLVGDCTSGSLGIGCSTSAAVSTVVMSVSAQNGVSISGGGIGDVLQPGAGTMQMLDHTNVTPPGPTGAAAVGTQNHQQLSQLLAGNSPANVGIRHSGVVAASSVVPPMLAANPRGVGVTATLSNNVVRGNITLVPTGPGGGGAPSAVLGAGHGPRVPTPQQQQQLVAINTAGAGVGGVNAPGSTLLSVSSSPQNPAGVAARLQPMSASAVMSLTAGGMVISVTQSQPGLQVSANGAHIGPTLVMPPRAGSVAQQRFTNATVQQQQQVVMDGGGGGAGVGSVPNVGLQCNPAAIPAGAQMTMSAIAPQQIATARVTIRDFYRLSFHLVICIVSV